MLSSISRLLLAHTSLLSGTDELSWLEITGHNEVVRVQYNPAEVSYETLLHVFWDRHDPTTLNRQVKSFLLSDALHQTSNY